MRHGASGPAWKEEISETLSRKLAPVPEIKGLSSPYDGSRSRDDGLPQPATDRRLSATVHRRATTGCRTRRRLAATCDGLPQVATDRRTATTDRRKLRQAVV